MAPIFNRRKFVMAGSAALAAGALPFAAKRASAQSAGELRINMSGGNFADALIKAFLEPFEAETGIKVVPVTQDLSAAQVGLMVETNTVAVDVVLINQLSSTNMNNNGLLEQIDYSLFRNEDIEAVPQHYRAPFGFSSSVWCFSMFYNTARLQPDKRPATWAEFWDVEKFPGARTLPVGQGGSRGPWEEALLADGVAVEDLYPLDIDRAFASLDKIKPHVRRWWDTGGEVLQIMRDGVADLGTTYDGRALSLIADGSPIELNFNQSKLNWDYWVIPKGSPNAENAQKFIAYTARADRQADFTKIWTVSPSNNKAFEALPDDITAKLATKPEHVANSYTMNAEWYTAVGADGLTNLERLDQRWREWVSL